MIVLLPIFLLAWLVVRAWAPDKPYHHASALEYPRTWWYRLALRLMPSRCREIPEPQDPTRIIMRQVAIVKRFAYLQQFCGGEDARYYHSHPWRRTFAIGLWGAYTERRLAGPPRRRLAPYCYVMDASVVHNVSDVSPGHTSIFVGIGRDESLKAYYGAPHRVAHDADDIEPTTIVKPALGPNDEPGHIKKLVARI